MSRPTNRSAQQVVRMLALVPYLQGNDGVPVHDVAREFGVPPKQIRDDLRLLMFTGVGEYAGELIDVDLAALEGDDVIHIRDAEFLSRPLRLTADEGIALVAALRTLRASAAGPQLPIVDAALAKLETAVAGDTAVEAVDVHVAEVDPAIRDTVAAALADGRRLELDYATDSRDDVTTRQVDPQQLFARQGHTYLEAYCLRAEDVRFFRLDRITRAVDTGRAVERHDTTARDLGDELFSVSDQTPSAVLDLDPAAHWLTEYYQVEELGEVDGRRRVRLYAGDEAWLRRLVLRNGGTVHVVEPRTLRGQVMDTARSALAAYDG
ncbi:MULTISPECIES: WYL domain-containing protein [unclassified Aeromicrobium]|uniref:helix-turn-helix transcriptional regulator n=1 Tax=unclassified Aeromicrobium TaxID=2633570 RepID=UPI00288970D2|nr:MULTISPECIES: WYL domain-containing protein [unclassified Aeromicrobium]